MAQAHTKHHDYHLVDPSPWPFIGSMSALALTIGTVMWMRGMTPLVAIAGMIGVAYVMISWWRDIINEAEHQGHHTKVVQIHLRYGMILFIASEVMFFVAWFWAFFEVALNPGDPHQFMRDALKEVYAGLEGMSLLDYKVRILPGGGTAAVTRVIIESGDETGRVWQTVGVSGNIIDASYEALNDAITYKLMLDRTAVPA